MFDPVILIPDVKALRKKVLVSPRSEGESQPRESAGSPCNPLMELLLNTLPTGMGPLPDYLSNRENIALSDLRCDPRDFAFDEQFTLIAAICGGMNSVEIKKYCDYLNNTQRSKKARLTGFALTIPQQRMFSSIEPEDIINQFDGIVTTGKEEKIPEGYQRVDVVRGKECVGNLAFTLLRNAFQIAYFRASLIELTQLAYDRREDSEGFSAICHLINQLYADLQNRQAYLMNSNVTHAINETQKIPYVTNFPQEVLEPIHAFLSLFYSKPRERNRDE